MRVGGGNAKTSLDSGGWEDTDDGSDASDGEYTGTAEFGTVDWLTALEQGFFDASDAGPTDNDSNWVTDSSAFNDVEISSAIPAATGTETTNELRGEGTSITGSGYVDGDIGLVYARIGLGTSNAPALTIKIYTDGEGEALATASHSSNGLGPWFLLTTPSSGWTVAKLQALEVIGWKTGGSTGGWARTQVKVLATDGDSNIKATKLWARVDRDGGGGTVHNLYLGDSGDGNNAVEYDDNTDWGEITTSPANYHIVQTSNNPTAAQDIRAGFGTGGAQDIHMYDGMVFLLHVPDGGDPPDPPSTRRVMITHC